MNKIKKYKILVLILLLFTITSCNSMSIQKPTKEVALNSIETKYTISKVRTAKIKNKTTIIASSYEGVILGVSYHGKTLWENPLSGFMNHDIWCQDITGDGNDEILAANADGNLYCLDAEGKLLWKFSKNEAPMKSVCVIKKGTTPYVVCGSYDTNIYYLNAKGELIEEINSKTYSKDKSKNKRTRKVVVANVANFLRAVKINGNEILVVHGLASTNANGSFYLFNPLEKTPFKKFKNLAGRLGEIRVVDVNHDGNDEILIGKTGEANKGSGFYSVDLETEKLQEFSITKLYRKLDAFGYRVTQPELIKDAGAEKYLVMFGSRILLAPLNMKTESTEVLACKYAFNDMWNDPENSKVILASSQSGGSCIHVIDLEKPEWKKDFMNLNPSGKIQEILENTSVIRKDLKNFKKPKTQNESAPVYFMSESRKNKDAKKIIDYIENKYSNPIFLIKPRLKRENWDRSTVENEKYRNKRDKRAKYVYSQDEAVDAITTAYNDGPGISYWAGHGNDPYMYQRSTTEKVLDKANGKKTVLIYPELEDHTEDFKYVMNDLIYPLADYSKDKNANIFVRTKHLFWQSSIYLPAWKRLISGEFSNVFIPSMEETTDKSMELSLAARMGIWTSGSIDSWGGRCARDNASFDRTRQHSHQMLPNHFLRTMVYTISSGAQYLDNFAVDQEYMSLLWELIAEGALYVPKRSEILNISPVHLSIVNPHKRYVYEGNDAKAVVYYNEDEEKSNPMVFSHLNGTWPGAPLAEWDFSRYAANAQERRLNFIPKYENGLVLITPPQGDVFRDKDATRKLLSENLHPIYKNIMKEYITDGKNYISPDGKQIYSAKEYYKIVEEAIKKSASLMPVTVSGNVGWVVAQTSPKHLRLTIVENGYINPNEAIATVKFNTIKPLKIVDILNKEEFKLSKDSSVDIKIPLGAFRFIDIELNEEL